MSHQVPGRSNRIGLAGQLWLFLVVPIAVVMGVYGILAQARRHEVIMSEASAEMRNYATLLEAAVQGPLERMDLEIVRRRGEHFARADRILGVAVFDSGGDEMLVTEGVTIVVAELRELALRAKMIGNIEQQTEIDGRPALLKSVVIRAERDGPTVVAVMVRDLDYVHILANQLNRGLFITGAVMLGIVAVIAGLVSKAMIGRPAGAIVAGAERVAAGQLDTTVLEEGAEELARLAAAFNTMTRSLREARQRADHEQAARAAAERKLQHAQALAAAGQVAVSIGHEIGSPLNVILGRARRAADQPGCPEPLRMELETIARQSERITRVVSRLLAVARPPLRVTEGSDLVRVTEEVVSFLAPECKKRNIRVRTDRAPDVPTPAHVALDADSLFQVVFNICLNAIEAQGRSGEIVVRFAADPDLRRLSLEVEDQGPGVPEAAAGQVFEPFFTTKSTEGGSGLGLAIVSGIVREAGGTVELEQPAPHGARFRVTLPTSALNAPGADAA